MSGRGTRTVCLCAYGRDADALGRADTKITDKHIVSAIGVASDEVVGPGRERDDLAVLRDDAATAEAVPLDPVATHADQSGRLVRPVPDEDVLMAVGVADHEIGSGRAERDKPAVRRRRTEGGAGTTGRLPADPDAQELDSSRSNSWSDADKHRGNT